MRKQRGKIWRTSGLPGLRDCFLSHWGDENRICSQDYFNSDPPRKKIPIYRSQELGIGYLFLNLLMQEKGKGSLLTSVRLTPYRTEMILCSILNSIPYRKHLRRDISFVLFCFFLLVIYPEEEKCYPSTKSKLFRKLLTNVVNVNTVFHGVQQILKERLCF